MDAWERHLATCPTLRSLEDARRERDQEADTARALLLKQRDETWRKRFTALRLSAELRTVAGAVEGALSGEDPTRFTDSFVLAAIEALESNRRTRGQTWRDYAEGGDLELADLHRAMRAYDRHSLTAYDDLLDRGVDRDTACDAARDELEELKRRRW